MPIDVLLEAWDGSPVIRAAGPAYRRRPAAEFRDEAADLSARQAVFYRNLIRIAEATGAGDLPVDFEHVDGQRLYLDRGCIKIAEHSGFILPLENGPDGVVDAIRLAFRGRRRENC
jgi:hypothetical protein